MRVQNTVSKFYNVFIKAFFIFLLCFPVSVTFAQVRDAFKLRGPGGLQSDPNTCIFSLHGDFTMIANVNLWATSGSDSQTRVNNGTNMARLDLDSDASTSNSSMSELKLYSSCSKIVYAGLYWTSRTASSITDAAKKTIKIKGPGATSYTTLTSPMYSRLPGDGNQYACFTDVTQYVQLRGAGQYWVADIALTEGSDSNTGNYAGWGMVVIYEDEALPMRNIAMFDGYAYVSGTQKFSIPVSGFKSAQTGPVKVKLGFMAGEGDAGYVGDWCQMRKATAVGDVNNDNDWIHLENPTTAFTSQNFWRSRVANDAGAVRNPNYTNNLGFDAFVLTADNTGNQLIGNNQTSTAIRYGTSQDQYLIFNMTMAVDAYEPDPVGLNQVSATGGSFVDQMTAAPGDNLTYRLNVTNQGNEAVLNAKIEIPIPYNATYIPGSIVATFDASLSGATATFDPAGQKIVVNLGTLPVAPTNNLNKIFASISYQLKATTDCYYLKNSNSCLRDITLQGTFTGTGAITGVAVNKKTISGYQTGTCSQSPITSPTTVSIVVPSSYPACDGFVATTPNLRICPAGASTIAATTIRGLLTLPSSITYVFNSASDGSGTVYNDNNPFPAVNGTYYAVPVNTINSACSGSIPFTITILSVNTPPTTPYGGTNNVLTFCPADLPFTLQATATSSDYTIFWYTQATGGNAVGGITIPSNITPGTYVYYVAQGYDAGCQSSRTAITVKINPSPVIPTFNGSTTLCGGAEDTYTILSPNLAYAYQWVLDNPPVGIAFKNSISTGNTVTLTETTTASGTFTIKVRARDTTTGCYSDYRSLLVTVNAKPSAPTAFTGPTEACEGSIGNIYTLNSTVPGMNYEWSYTGTGYTWADGTNIGPSVEIRFAEGATSGTISVRAKNAAGCYSDTVKQTIIINPRPVAPANVSADSICIGQSAIIKINNSGTLKYQVYFGTTLMGGLVTGNNGLLSINIGTAPVAGDFNFTVKSYNDKCYSTAETPVLLTVLSTPNVPVLSSGITVCYATKPVVQVLNAAQNITYNVYDNPSLSGTPLNTVVATASPLSITINDTPVADKTYYIVASNKICASPSTSVVVTARNQIDAPTLSSANICAGQKPSITISNPPIVNGLFDNSIYQYKVYSDAGGNNEIALVGNPEQVGVSTIVLSPNTTIMSNTTLYVRLVAYACNGPLSPVSVQIAARPTPSVLTPVTQCLETLPVVTIYNTVKGNHYRVYNVASGGTALQDITSLQNGDMVISLPSGTSWSDGTIFYVEESVRNDADQELCISPRAQLTMQSGTAPAPAFTFSPAYICSATTATLTINNALKDHTYNIYDSQNGSTKITSVDPGNNISQYTFNVSLPANFVSSGGTVTYWMDMVENGSTCNSDRTPVTITLATPPAPVLDNNSLSQIICRGTIPVVTVNNAKKDVSYTVYDNSNSVISGPLTAPADGTLNISLASIVLTGGQTLQLYIQAQAPATQNNCLSDKTNFTLTDGEPVMPTMANLTICHGEPIITTIATPVAGYQYQVYNQSDMLVGLTNGLSNIVLNSPSIPNPGYPSAYTNLNYYVKAKSSYCTSEANAPFTVKVNRTVEAGVDFTVSNPSVCLGTDAVVNVQIAANMLATPGDLTLKWYYNSDLTDLPYTQTYPSGTSNINQTFSNLITGTYVYYLTVENTTAGLCANKVQNAGVAVITVRPLASFADLTALDATICNGDSVTLEAQLANSAITNPIFNWYSDSTHTTLVASNTQIFTPSPYLTKDTVYYVTVHNDIYCENKVGDDQMVVVTVNKPVLAPSVAIAGNAAAICAGNDLTLEITSVGSVSGYELWENGILMPPASYTVDMPDNIITVLSPSVGVHTYSVVSQLYANNILCESDPTAASATVSVIVNNPVNQPLIALVQAGVCQGQNTVFNVTYTGAKPSGYILYSGTGVQDTSLYTVSTDMRTITLQQPVVGHHSYTLVSFETVNGITCQSLPSTSVESDVYPHPTATISNIGLTKLCKNDQTQLKLDFTGTAPFAYTVQAVDVNNQITYIAENVVTNLSSVTLNHTPTIATTYSIFAVSDNYCNALASGLNGSVTVNVYPELNAGALVTDLTICNNTSLGEQSVTLAFDGNIANYQYSWQQWNGSSFEAIQPAVTTATYNPGVLTTGVYRYQRTVTDGCQTKAVQNIITVLDNLQAGALVAPLSICNGTSPGGLSLSLPSGGSTANYSYSWQIWNGSYFENITPVITTADYNPGTLTSGTYRYQRTISDGCQIHTSETTVTVYSDLQAGSLVTNKSVCLGTSPGELSLNLPSGGTANYIYSWQLWNGSSYINITPAVTTANYDPGSLSSIGDYQYQRTVTDGCQTTTAVVKIGVYSDLSPGALIADTVLYNNTSPGNLNSQPAQLCGGGLNISYQWYTSTDGITWTLVSGANPVDYNPGSLASGKYYYKREVTDGISTLFVTTTVTVLTDLQPGTLIANVSICNGSSPGELGVNLPSGGNTANYTYSWQLWNGTSFENIIPAVTTATYHPGALATGTYRWQRTVSDGYQTRTVGTIVTVYSDLQAGSLIGNTSICLNSSPGELSLSLPSGGNTANYTYSWQLWNGNSFIDIVPAITTVNYNLGSLNQKGDYLYQRTVTDGCQAATSMVKVSVYSDLTPGALHADTTICNNTSPGNLNIQPGGFCGGGSNIDYQWYTSTDGVNWTSISGANTVDYTPNNLTNGLYYYKREVSDGIDTLFVTTTVNALADLQPGVLLAPMSICQGTFVQNLNLLDASRGNITNYNYSWQVWNGTSFENITPAVTTASYNPGTLSPGTYRWQRSITDGCQTRTVETSITVLDNLQAGSLIAPVSIWNGTSPGELNLSLPLGGNVDNYSYSWQLWNGTSFENIVPSITSPYYNPGTLTVGNYKYQRTITDGCQTAVSEVLIGVYSGLQPGALKVDTVICNNNSPGNLSIQPAGLSGGSSVINYQWYTSMDGLNWTSISGASFADYTPNNLTSGKYYYKREANDGTTTLSATTTVIVLNDLQPGSLIANKFICNSTSSGDLTLQGASGGNSSNYTYSWQVWNGASFEDIIPTVTTVGYNPGTLTTGVYRYQRSVTDGCQTRTTETTVTVYSDLQAGSLVSNMSVCLGTSSGELNLSLPTGGNNELYSYLWQIWNGTSFENISPVVTTANYNPGVLALGPYQYRRMVRDGCQTATAVVKVGVYSDLHPGALLADTAICNGTSPGNLNIQAADLCGGSSNISYKWYTSSDGVNWTLVSDVSSVDYNPGNLSSGIYYYKREASDGENTVSDATSITVLDDLQSGTLQTNTSICNGTSPGNLNVSLPLGGNTKNYSYSWQVWNGTSFENINPMVTTASYNPGVLTTGTYRWQRTVTDGCQTRTAQATVIVLTDLQAGSLINDTSVYSNHSPGELNLSLPSGGNVINYNYSWQLWNGTSFENIVPLVNTAGYNPGVLTAGTYRYQRTISDGCQTRVAETTITVLSDLLGGSLIENKSICVGTSPGDLSFSLPSGGNVANYVYSWQLWDGTVYKNITPAVTTANYNPGVLTLGTYQYQRTVTDGNQTATAIVKIGVYSDLHPGALISDKTICNNTSPDNLNIQAANLCGGSSNISYQWYTSGDGVNWTLVSEANSVDYNPGTLTSGVYHYKREVSDGTNTIFDATIVTVFENLEPGSLQVNTSICNNTSPGELNLSLPSGGNADNYTYLWQVWNGSSFTAISPAITTANYNPGVLTTGTYRYQRSITDGCQTRTTETTVNVYSDLQAGSLIANTFVYPNNSPGNLDHNLPSGGNASNYSYSWQVWNGSSFENISPAVTTSNYNPGVLTPGTYRYQRTITDGCQTRTAETTVTVYSALQPGSLVANKSVCLGTSLGDLSLSLPLGGNAANYSYSWQLWNGSAFVNITPVVTTANYNPGVLPLGTYQYQRTVSDGYQTATAVVKVGVYSDLHPGALLADTTICNNTSPGNLNIQAADLCGGSSNINYQWYTSSDGINWTLVSDANSVDYNPGNLSSGIYYYKREASDGANTVFDVTSITVLGDLQSGTLHANASICNNTSPGNLSLSLPSGGNASNYSYSWQVWNGSSFENISPAVTTANYNPGVLTPGTYRYQRTITDGCQTRTAETTVTVYVNLQAGSLVANKSVCLGTSLGDLSLSLPLGGNAANYSYSWQLWNGTSFDNINPMVTTASYNPGVLPLGIYQYQRTVSDGCQTATAAVKVGVYSDLHPGALIADTTICNNASPGNLNIQAADLCGGSSTIGYQWYTSSNGVNWTLVSGASSVDYNPGTLTSGVYYYKREVSDGANTVSDVTSITVLGDLQSGTLQANAFICNNTSPGNLSVSLPSGGNTSKYSYSWQVWNGNSFINIIPIITTSSYNPGVLTTGTCRYQRTITDGCQTQTAETTVTVYSDLQAGGLVANKSIYPNTSPEELSVTLPSGGNATNYSYSWQLWNGSSFVNITPAVTTANYNPGVLTTAGTYRWQRTVSDGCQTRTIETTITVLNELNFGRLVDNMSICDGASPGNLSKTYPEGGNYTYSWELFDGINFVTISGATSPDYNPGNLSSGVYRYRRIVTNGVDMGRAETIITVLSRLEINVTPHIPSGKVNLGSSISFTVTPSDYVEYKFTYLTKSVSQQNNTYTMYNWNPGVINNLLITVVDERGCTNSEDYSFKGPLFDLPNIITPDGDGYNDLLLPGYDIEVFNRWGSRLFHGTEGWDGRYNNQSVAVGTYYYIVHLTFPDGTTTDIKHYVFVKH